jgi:alpha-1,3-rhamnosyl/mannosyltransferase
VLIRAFGRFLKLVKKPYELVLVGGDFWPDPEIERTIKALKLDHSIVRPGYVPDADLAGYYRGAAGFVTLSLHEGFSIPVAEAMASGIPLVVAASGALPEIAGNAGVKVRAEDAGMVATAMAEIIKPEVAVRLISYGLKLSARYNWRNFTGNVVSVIDQYAGNNK